MKKISRKILAILLGLFFILLILEIILRIFGWWQLSKYSFKNIKKDANRITILILGDSMTALGGEDSYPAQLEKILNKNVNKKVNFKVLNLARVNTDSDFVRNYLFNFLENNYCDFVIILTGYNDFGVNKYEENHYINLNDIYQFKSIKFGQFIISNTLFEVRKNISNHLLNIGIFLKQHKHNLCAKFIFDRSIFLFPEGMRGYVQLVDLLENGYLFDISDYPPRNKRDIGKVYLSRKEYLKAMAIFDEILKNNPSYLNKNFFRILSKIYKIIGNLKESEKFYLKSLSLSNKTKENYRLISSLLEKKKIPLIAVQYPTLDITILKTYLKDKPNTYFVDNNESFEKAIEKYGYDYLFIDKFAGDFGHGSKYGNQLIAENVAKVILEEVLKHE